MSAHRRLDALLRVIEFVQPAVAPGVDLERELAADPEGLAHLDARADADRAHQLEADAQLAFDFLSRSA